MVAAAAREVERGEVAMSSKPLCGMLVLVSEAMRRTTIPEWKGSLGMMIMPMSMNMGLSGDVTKQRIFYQVRQMEEGRGPSLVRLPGLFLFPYIQRTSHLTLTSRYVLK